MKPEKSKDFQYLFGFCFSENWQHSLMMGDCHSLVPRLRSDVHFARAFAYASV